MATMGKAKKYPMSSKLQSEVKDKVKDKAKSKSKDKVKYKVSKKVTSKVSSKVNELKTLLKNKVKSTVNSTNPDAVLTSIPKNLQKKIDEVIKLSENTPAGFSDLRHLANKILEHAADISSNLKKKVSTSKNLNPIKKVIK